MSAGIKAYVIMGAPVAEVFKTEEDADNAYDDMENLRLGYWIQGELRDLVRQ